MDRNGTDFASRRRTLDVPAKPEAGLAEWTTKIKELQRQVDADEEAETKRLEEEIAASRLARMRRSTGGRGESTDLSTTDVAAALKEPPSAAVDQPYSADERRRNQDDALKKLSNDGPDRSLADYNSYIASKSMKSSAAAPMSLAAFMGGKATGPRLNKHAPQQDAHDPTQFAQRPITGPHPIFGRGGIAMPGMVGGSHATGDRREATPSPKSVSPRAPDGPVQSVSPAFESLRVKSAVEKVESPRQRTFSTPIGSTPARTSFGASFNEVKHEKTSPRPLTHSPSPVIKGTPRATTPKEQSSPAYNHMFPARSNNVSPHPRSPGFRSPSPPKTPTLGSSPGLAKPIQPSPRKSLQGPQIPVSPNPSTAFLRPPPAKELTPSISRLQGRGFVQSMVRASSQLETGSPSGNAASGDNGLVKKASVLDRWQRGNEAAPVIAPKPLPLRKVRTTDSSPQTASVSSPVQVFPTYTPPPPKPDKPDFTSMTLKSRVSLPSISSTQEHQSPSQKSDASVDSPTPSQRRALGSSSTMVSYIKPIKTGDGPGVTSSPSRPSSTASRSRPTTPGVDELGVRVRSRTGSIGGEAEKGFGTPGAGASGKPLNHPTKHRPHKPRKAKTMLTQSPKEQHEIQVDRLDADKYITPGASIEEEKLANLTRDVKDASHLSPPDDDKSSNASESPPTPGASRRVHFPLPLDIPSVQAVHHAEKSPVTPSRHSRIPSTGNRATVMDVVQVFNEHEYHGRPLPLDVQDASLHDHSPLTSPPPATEEESPVRPDVKSMVSNWDPHDDATAHGAPDKRKPSYEKYSAFVLPPLVEEKTPVPSPAGTLTRNAVPPSISAFLNEDRKDGHPTEEQPVSLSKPQTSLSLEADRHEQKESEGAYVHLEINDEPLPWVDVDALLVDGSSVKMDPDIQTISVEVISIVGTSATSINRDTSVFYDTETLAIIHRSKAKSSGLVSTKVWSWRGARAQPGEREERKLQELARRYNTPLIPIEQYAEPAELVHILGGQLATRQGSRAHWTTENTAMHMIRSVDELTYIDELELSIRNLCSGFSYCLSILETFYVWYGRGSTVQERQAALTYAQTLASNPSNVIELSEETGDDDEMFWIILGEGDYGKADYWRWKSAFQTWKARIWLVDTGRDNAIIYPINTLKGVSAVHDHVYIVDCLWEYFVIVGTEARGRRKDIRLALTTATQMSTKLAPTRPYAPTVHVLVLPSRLPIDLRLAFRDMDESYLNRGNVPEHMNLLAAEEAFEHLEKTFWERNLLKDPTKLPLGLDNVL